MSLKGQTMTIEDLLAFKKQKKPKKEDVKLILEDIRSLIELWEPYIFVGTIQNLIQEQINNEYSLFSNDRDFITNESGKNFKNISDFLKTYKPGDTPPSLPKLPKQKDFTQLKHTGSSQQEIWKIYLEFHQKIQELLDEIKKLGMEAKNNKKRIKDLEKTVNKRKGDILKNLEGLKKRLEDVDKRTKTNQQNFLKKMEKDYSKLLRDSKKLFLNSSSPEFKTLQGSSKDSSKFSFIKYQQLYSPISKEIEENCNFEGNFPPTSQSVQEYARLLIFNEVSKSILNKAILEILKGDNKSSSVLLEFFSNVKFLSSENEDENDFIERFKKFLRNNAEKKIKIIIESIINQISNSYISKSLKTYPVFKKHIEIACFDLGEIPEELKEEFKIIPKILGPNLHNVKVEDKHHLFLEIEEFPSSGNVLPVLRAIGQSAWNSTIADQLGFFIEILKMSSELLGELKRKKFQNLIETFYELTF
jgi:hypothetical protein